MGVQRLGYSTYSTYSKDAGESGGSAAWRGFNAGKWRAILLQYCGNKSPPWSIFESNRGGSSMQGIPAFPLPLSVEGVFQMAYILPERLLALVRPAFDLVLRRIRSLKRCVQACGCKIETPRYALQFGSRLHFKRCQALPKETPFPFFFGDPFFWDPLFSFFFF